VEHCIMWMMHQHAVEKLELALLRRSSDEERVAGTLVLAEHRLRKAAAELDASNTQALAQQALYASHFGLLADVLLSGQCQPCTVQQKACVFCMRKTNCSPSSFVRRA